MNVIEKFLLFRSFLDLLSSNPQLPVFWDITMRLSNMFVFFTFQNGKEAVRKWLQNIINHQNMPIYLVTVIIKKLRIAGTMTDKSG